MSKRIIIIGAGPCGLGAGYRLAEMGYDNFQIYEKTGHPGGLSASIQDGMGFTWDFAIHVFHSHYDYVDKMLARAYSGEMLRPTRKSWIRLYDRWIPYPFQYNIRHLPENIRDECLRELKEAKKHSTDDASSFYEWIISRFGKGIARHFLIPYNEKNWSIDLREMGFNWQGERVPTVDVDRVEANIRDGRDDVNWGPNAHFMFPKRGGTGAIFNAVAQQIPQEKIRYDAEVVRIDVKNKEIYLSNGHRDSYDALITSIPLKELCFVSCHDEWARQAAKLRHTRTYVHGIAYHEDISEELHDKTWIYCPEKQACFYRVTPFSNLAPSHVPGDRWCSFLTEISSPDSEPVKNGSQWDVPIAEGMAQQFGMETKEPAHIIHMQTDYGYPIPTTDRDTTLHRVLPEMQAHGIYSRGRFGAWKYEVGNMDHSIMQGVEAVDCIVHGNEEVTWRYPGRINK